MNEENKGEQPTKTEKLKKESVNLGIVKRHGFATTDGKLWENQDEALIHQRELGFDDWFNAIDELPDGHCQISGDGVCSAQNMREWLTENKAAVKAFLGE